MSEPTEDPTPARLRRAEAEGDVAVSAPFGSACAFLVASTMLTPIATELARWARWSLGAAFAVGARDPEAVAMAALTATVSLVTPIALASAGTAALVGGAQAGGVFAPARVTPDLGRLAPSRGLASLWAPQRLASLLRAVVMLAIFGALCRRRLLDGVGPLLAAASPSAAISAAAALAAALLRDAGLLLLVGGLADVVVSRRARLARLRMTHDQIKREHRESEGDPRLKAARERAHHELLAQASIHAVNDATVLVVNPTHLATALRYRDGEDEAPSVVAKGEGDLAARMIEAARHGDVPVVRDVPLARALHELEVGEQIPEALYEAVAEVLRSLWEVAEGAPPAEGSDDGSGNGSGEGDARGERKSI